MAQIQPLLVDVDYRGIAEVLSELIKLRRDKQSDNVCFISGDVSPVSIVDQYIDETMRPIIESNRHLVIMDDDQR